MKKVGVACSVMAFALVAAISPAQAVLFTKGITLSGTSPTYTPAGSTTAIPYQVFAFSIDMTGSYNLNLGSSGGYYPSIALYQPYFTASSPSANLLASSQTGGFGSSFTTTLTAGTTYTLALGGKLFAAAGGSNPPQYFGQLGINGPGTVTEEAVVSAPVPEPATWTMMVGGFGMIGGILRRRKVKLSFA